MKQEVCIKYINDAYNLGLVSWKEAYVLKPNVLKPNVVKLKVEYYKCNLVYRAPGSAKRMYYRAAKMGLKPCNIRIVIDHQDAPF